MPRVWNCKLQARGLASANDTRPHGSPAAHATQTDNWGSLALFLNAILILTLTPQSYIETVEQTGDRTNYSSQAPFNPIHIAPWTTQQVAQPFTTNLFLIVSITLPLVV